MTLGSLFDGSGTAPLAATMCGIEPIWCSEIEPFPIAVTRARFPQMKHYGNVCDINGGEVEPVDIIAGGSPCQDLSVAGKRAGLTGGERSVLFLEQIRIIKEMRDASTARRFGTDEPVRPRFAIWENVPGAFSSNKGEDFRVVLEEFCKIADESAAVPRPEKWRNAGCIVGNGWSVCWRVLDAQHFGVPQRRRRIFLVADFGSECAAEILSEQTGVSGNTPQGSETGQGVAEDAGRGFGETECYGIDQQGGKGGANFMEGIMPTLLSDSHGTPHAVCYGICSDKSNSMLSPNPHRGIYEADTTRTLDGNGGNPSCNQGGMAIVEPICNNGDTVARALACRYDGSPCLDRGQNIVCISGKQQSLATKIGIANTLGANNYKEPQSVCFENHQFSGYREGCGTLKASGGDYGGGSENIAVEVFDVDCRNGAENADLNGTLQAKPNGGYNYNSNQTVRTNDIVRRLTPAECAKLQGFPPNWCGNISIPNPTESDISFWQSVWDTYCAINGKTKKSRNAVISYIKNPYSDSAEYKMWGNGMALPCVNFIIRRIKEEGTL